MASCRWLCRVICVGLVLLNVASFCSAAFNCTRIGTGCNNGGICDPAYGTCTCVGSTYTGYDCSVDQQYTMQGACLANNPCLNGGVCYDMSATAAPGGTLCHCPYEYYGEQCQLSTVYNECYPDQMVVNINPGQNFAGVVGIQHTTGFCDIMPVTAQSEFSLDPKRKVWQGYAAVLPFSAAACGDGPTVNTTVTEIIYTYEVVVRYDATGMTPQLDEIITFSCPVPNPAAPPSRTAVLFSVTDSQGAFISQPKLGSPFIVTFYVDPHSNFNDVAVRTCAVFNAGRNTFKTVVQDGCPVWPFGRSLVKQGAKHILTMITHTFGKDPQLNFECAVKVCNVSDPTCQQQPVCPAPMPTTATGNAGGASARDTTLETLLGTADPTLNIFQAFGSGSPANILDSLLPSASPPVPASGNAAPSPAGGSGSNFNLNDMLNMLGSGPGGAVPTGILNGGLTDIFGPAPVPASGGPVRGPTPTLIPSAPPPASSSQTSAASSGTSSSTSSGASAPTTSGTGGDLLGLLGSGSSISDIFMALGGGGGPAGGAAGAPARRRREAERAAALEEAELGSRIFFVRSGF